MTSLFQNLLIAEMSSLMRTILCVNRVNVNGNDHKKGKSSKSEARNLKSETIFNNQNPNVPNKSMGVSAQILFLSLGHLVFEFVSNFEIRVSDFANARTANHALWA